MQETTASLWQETLNVNVIAAAELTRRLLPALRRAAGTATELLRRVRKGHGKPYAAEDCLSPETVAGVILDVAEMRGDGYLAEVTLVRNSKRDNA